jgi:hypothetical protein
MPASGKSMPKASAPVLGSDTIKGAPKALEHKSIRVNTRAVINGAGFIYNLLKSC